MLGLFLGSYFFSEGLIIGRNFAFQNELGFTIKTDYENSLKQLAVTVHGFIFGRALLLEGVLPLRFGGLIFRRASFFWKGGGLILEFYVVKITLGQGNWEFKFR